MVTCMYKEKKIIWQALKWHKLQDCQSMYKHQITEHGCQIIRLSNAVQVAKASNYKIVNKEHGDMHGQAYEKQLNRLVK